MGVILHGVTHNVGHFVESAVVEGFHRVEDASLHRFETVVDVGDGTVEDGAGCIVEIPALEHSAQMLAHNIVAQVNKHGGKAAFRCLCAFLDIVVVYFVAHVYDWFSGGLLCR